MAKEWITDYTTEVLVKRPNEFCEKQKQLCRLILKLLDNPDIYYKDCDPERFRKFALYFKHKEGVWAGKPFVLNKVQLFITACVLGIKIKNNDSLSTRKYIRYFRELNLFVARKFGKTMFISVLAAFLLAFDHEKGAFGEILAENTVQSKKLFDEICFNTEQEEFKDIFSQVRTEKKLVAYDVGKNQVGELHYLSGRKKGKQGSNPSFFINDEANEITYLGQYSDKAQGMGAREQPLAIVISSAGITPDSLYEMLYERDAKILERANFNDKQRVFPCIFEIDANDEPSNEKCWIKANPTCKQNVPSITYLEQLYENSKGDILELAKFTAYNLNRQLGAGLSFYDMNDIKKCMNNTITKEDIYDTYAVGGVDLSSTTDLCNATACILGTDKMIILQAYFIAEDCLMRNSRNDQMDYQLLESLPTGLEPTSRLVIITPGATVDYHYVTQWFCQLRDEYHINFLKIGYDKAMANYWVADMNDKGFNHEKVAFDKDLHVESRDYGILTPCYQGIGLNDAIRVIKGYYSLGTLKIDKTNKLFAYCFYNLKVVANTDNMLSCNKLKSTGHIDGCIGLFNSYLAYRRAKELDDYKNSISYLLQL